MTVAYETGLSTVEEVDIDVLTSVGDKFKLVKPISQHNGHTIVTRYMRFKDIEHIKQAIAFWAEECTVFVAGVQKVTYAEEVKLHHNFRDHFMAAIARYYEPTT